MSTESMFIQIAADQGHLYALDTRGIIWWCRADNMKSHPGMFDWEELNMSRKESTIPEESPDDQPKDIA